MKYEIVRDKIQAKRELKDQEIHETITWNCNVNSILSYLIHKSMSEYMQMGFNIDREEKKEA